VSIKETVQARFDRALRRAANVPVPNEPGAESLPPQLPDLPADRVLDPRNVPPQ
jgi:hypothetical protein